MAIRPLEHKLVGLILDCVDSQAGFQPALAAIASWMGGHSAHSLFMRDGHLVETHFHGATDASFSNYEVHWRHQDPRLLAAMKNPGKALSDVDVIEPDDFEASSIYNDLLMLQGVRYTLFACVSSSPGLMVGHAVMREKQAGPFGEDHVRMFSEVLPYLQNAAYLRLLLEGMRHEIGDLRRTLDIVPGAVAVLDEAAHLICANTAAEQLLFKADGLQVKSQKLTADRSGEAQRLTATVARSAAFSEATPHASSEVPVHSPVKVTRRNGAPLSILFVPLRPMSPLRGCAPRSARVLAVIHDPDAALLLDPQLIAGLHGLTSAESLLASALAQGKTLAEFAEHRGCSEQTARTHLKRVLEKTGTRRQAELVRMLLGSAALHLANAR
ncbi:LuxR family transcriptional regulator [Myxococcus stipitatus DSM 14675]|uniref:LuxR family transcriptional regulator n=1 Tax=Myxococcus stipitatus (strain DSM 14675 / JCM 12634 / Mx s8) TaxID=1278073 RepID=L7U2A1_MYXSD|nr:helix-turn-helix transcriptional regulator [Myxococcus stipitatus]AGC42343.1 LuxR family transcriptional regulator [Myxococcus stipitatus DSM 14675]